MNETVLQSIGERLRNARERAGFTLDQTAERAGISKAHLSRLESAERQPSLAALLDLAGVLRVSVGALLGESVAGAPIAIHTPGEAGFEAGGLAFVG
ncbi:MAG: helix-turn-helix domain-containing protein, partial [Acidimicrobiales bacterium]